MGSKKAGHAKDQSGHIRTQFYVCGQMLMTIVHQHPFVHAWLTVKVLLIVVYIALGIFAFRKGRRRPVRIGSRIAALVVYAYTFSVARAHDALGLFSGLA
jgi:uncharacterized membrane protein SirB2